MPVGTPRRDSILVHSELGADEAHFCRCDEVMVGDGDLLEFAVELRGPESEEVLELRKSWVEVVVLPDVALQQGWMIWQMVEDLCRRQAVTLHKGGKLRIGHRLLPRSDAPRSRLDA